MINLLQDEAGSWLTDALRWLPGRIGIRLRYEYYRRRLAACGISVSILPGCFLRECGNISLGSHVGLGLFSQVYASGSGNERIEIGNHVYLNSNVMINADHGGRITIGDHCIIGPNVVFRTSNHDFSRRDIPIKQQGHIPGVITVKGNVWIGAHVSVIGNVTIGEGAVLGAGSVVVKDVEPFTVAAGVPARPIAERGNLAL